MANLEASYRIIVADSDALISGMLKAKLEERGFAVFHTRSVEEMRMVAQRIRPHFIIADLMFPEMNGLQIVDWAKSHGALKSHTQVIVMGAHNSVANVKSAIRNGAVDYWIKPLDIDGAIGRLVFHISRRKVTGESEPGPALLDPSGAQLHLMDLMMRECMKYKVTEDSLFNVSRMIALYLKCVRVSVVACADELESGWVIASSDERSAAGLQIKLERYPEINHVMLSDQMAIIENMENDPALAAIKAQVKSISFNSIIVTPVYRKGKVFGVLSCRMGLEYKSFLANHIRFVRMAGIMAGFLVERDERAAFAYARKAPGVSASGVVAPAVDAPAVDAPGAGAASGGAAAPIPEPKKAAA